MEKLTTNNLYLESSLNGLRRCTPGTVDLVVADFRQTQDAPPTSASGSARRRVAVPTAQQESERISVLLEGCRNALRLFNGFFFATKAQLPIYIGFAQHHGLAWDMLVWEHGMPGGYELQPSCTFVVSIWERGAWFNPEMKHSFYEKVKRFGFERTATGARAGKPVRLLQEMLLQRSRPADIVLDPTADDGTLAALCAQMGRQYIAIESRPQRYALARQRLADAEQVRATAAPLQLEIGYPSAGVGSTDQVAATAS
jgi:hypothetical protein